MKKLSCRTKIGQVEAENNLMNEQKDTTAAEQDTKQQEPKVVVVKQPVRQQDSGQSSLPVQQVAEQPVVTRVVVGSYATEKQAEVAKSIIQDAGLGITPVVKNIGGYYTLQVGSYSSKEKAQQVMNNLLRSNFPARTVTN